MKGMKSDIPYVQSSASQDVPPPYHFPNVTVHSFVWKVRMATIKDYCDRFLNLGTREERGFEYRPAPFWPYAMLLFLDYPVMISSARVKPYDLDYREKRRLLAKQKGSLGAGDEAYVQTPYGERGITSQSEVFVAVPVVRYGNGPAGMMTQSSLEWILPFIVVSEPWSCVCGREMLGLGKLLADIETREGRYHNSFEGNVHMPGWVEQGMRRAEELTPFLNIRTGPTLPTFRLGSAPESTLSTLADSRTAGRAMEGMATLSNFVDYASLGMIPTAMRTLGLKQYRDAARPDRAIYQALVTCRSHYANIRNLKLYAEEDADITFFDKAGFGEILDVFLGKKEDDATYQRETDAQKAAGVRKVETIAAFRFEADVDYDRMRVIHEFPIEGGDGIAPRPGKSNITTRWLRPLQGFFGREPLE